MGYGVCASGFDTEEAFQPPAGIETLGGPLAVEQKQTNGLNDWSSVAQEDGGGMADATQK